MEPGDRRAQLLLAAREVFAHLGYHKAGVSDIIERAGVARGTFYNYFDSKRVAFQAVLEDMMDEVVGGVRPIDVGQDIPAQVRANLDRICRAVMAEDVVRVLFSEAVGIDAEGDALLRDFYASAIGRIERALRTGQRLGVVRDGEVRLRARALLGVIKEPLFQASLFGESPDADAFVEELLPILWGLLQ